MGTASWLAELLRGHFGPSPRLIGLTKFEADTDHEFLTNGAGHAFEGFEGGSRSTTFHSGDSRLRRTHPFSKFGLSEASVSTQAEQKFAKRRYTRAERFRYAFRLRRSI